MATIKTDRTSIRIPIHRSSQRLQHTRAHGENKFSQMGASTRGWEQFLNTPAKSWTNLQTNELFVGGCNAPANADIGMRIRGSHSTSDPGTPIDGQTQAH